MATRKIEKGMARQAIDFARVRRTMSPPQRNFLSYATVGHTDDLTGLPETTPQFVRIEQGQIWVECTLQPDGDEIVARLGDAGAGADAGWYVALEFGARVVVEMIRGNPQNAVIVARLHDKEHAMPSSVAGIQTGAAGAQAPAIGVPAPMWQFVKTPAGQLLAIETGAAGDVLIHTGTGGGVEIVVDETQAIHLNGRTHLGDGPTTPPVGATVGPAGTQLPGVPMVPRLPVKPPGHIPPIVTVPAPAAVPPYVGDADSIVRVKDSPQSDITIDVTYWTWFAAADVLLKVFGLVAPTPLSLTSDHRTASKHTASD